MDRKLHLFVLEKANLIKRKTKETSTNKNTKAKTEHAI